MTDQERALRERASDAGDVVEGPIGSARLRDPGSGATGADLGALPPIDGEPGASREGSPIDGGPIDGSAPEERQDRDHVGVDWDLTQRDRG